MAPKSPRPPAFPKAALSWSSGATTAIAVLTVLGLLLSAPWGSIASPTHLSAGASTAVPVALLSSGVHRSLGSDRRGAARPWTGAERGTGGPVSGAVGSHLSAGHLLPAWSYTNISVGASASGAAFDDAAGTLLVGNLNPGSSTMVLVDLASDSVVATSPVGNEPQGVAYDPGTGNFYVADWGIAGLQAINGSTGALGATIPVGCDPIGVVYDPANGDLYVTDMGTCSPATGEVDVVDPTSGTVIATIPIGSYLTAPGGEALAANLQEVAVADADGNVSIINVATHALTRNVRAFTPPAGSTSLVEQIAYDPSNDNVYVPNGAASDVSLVNLSQALTTGQVGVGSTPWGVQYEPGTQQVLVANEFSGNATEISGSSGLAVGSIPLGGYPTFLAFDATRNVLEASNGADAELLTPSAASSLSGVTVSPNSQTLSIGSSSSFTAQPSCTGGPCPSSVNFTWSLSSAMGQLSSPWGNPVTFTAGTTSGSVVLSVVATLQGLSATGQSTITISATVPTLTAVHVTFQGSGSWLDLGGTEGVTAVPVCSTGSCPYGARYVWDLTNSLGELNHTSGGPLVGGPSIQLTSGLVPGLATLFLNVSLNGVQVAAPPTSLVFTVYRSMMAPDPVPDHSSNGYGTSTSFLSTPSCTPNACPTPLSYSWSLDPSSLGTVSPATGNPTTFTAGSTTVSGNMSLLVTFEQPYWGTGGSVQTFGFSWFANATISVAPSTGNSSTTQSHGGPTLGSVLLIAVAAVAAAAVVLVLLLLRRKRAGPGMPPSYSGAGGSLSAPPMGSAPPAPPAPEPSLLPPPPPPPTG